MSNKMEPPKRRRLKVVRACRECRRKKTKCDGEKTCSACIKSQTECQYITSKQVSEDHTLETIGTTTVLTSTRQKKHIQKKHHPYQLKHHQKNSQSTSSLPSISHHYQESPTLLNKQPVPMTDTIHSIEKRLSIIEEQLKYIFQHQHYHTPSTPPLTTANMNSLPPLSTSISPISSPSSTSSKNDTISYNDSSLIQPYQNEKNISNLLTLPPLQHTSTSSLYNNHSDHLIHKKIPLLQTIFHDK